MSSRYLPYDRVAAHIHVAVGLKEHSATGHTSHLLGATVQFLTEMLVIEVAEPNMRRQPNPATYSVSFVHEDGLVRCLDTMMSFPRKPATPRLSLRPDGYREKRPEWPVSAMRFDFDTEHAVAAAVLLALDRDAVSHTWMTQGDAAHDSWDPDNKRFPPESFITIAELREIVVQWAFGDVLPPPATRWTTVPHEDVGWS